ncbi:MAG TPA: aldo/keto reductase, partial [Pelomicrobium sp.]|nr:aldo/keto reductase [Pelomicrobium sp.]
MTALPASPGRRRALKLLAASTAACAFDLRAETPMPDKMLKRAIPRSGELLPAVGLGTYRTFDVGGSAAEREPLVEVLRLLVAYGGSVVDSSPMYGAAESVVGDLAAEAGVAERLFYATKVWTSGREAGIRQMEESFRRMRVARMDLMQVHNLLDLETHRKTLEAWKKDGRVRYIGVTHYHEGAYDALERVIKTRTFDFVQLNYSIVEREAEERLLPLAQETGTAVIVNRPFAQANLFSRVRGKSVPDWCGEFDCASWAQFFLKYILAHPAVTCVIPATSKPKHLVDNMMAGVGRLPDDAQRRRMAAFMD